MDSKRIKILLMGSGVGSNAKNLLELGKNENRVEFLGIVSDKANAKILDLGAEYKVATYIYPRPNEEQLAQLIREKKPDWILLAGYLSVLSKNILAAMRENTQERSRVLNIHPSLLPSFSGLKAYEQAFNYGVKVSGVTIHFVDEGLDTGPIIAQKHFYREESDSLEDFIQKGKALEKELYAEVFNKLVEGKISIQGASRWIRSI
ncbi:MAG: phosphoribosylglycinamide formyltransferase [Oligoflexia bacterium]|nr:phosphoribosylglycinamide formyltransferase [Oligoflexia bacterium]